MAPKSLPPIAKQNLILAYFQKSGTAHSIKDLEKSLPSVASINGMQVKDYLTALADEGRIHVEKIGSVNWFWSFPSEEKRSKEKVLDGLKAEKEKIDAAIADLQSRIEQAATAREEEAGAEDGQDRESLTRYHVELQEDMAALRAELATYSDTDPVEVQRKKEECARLRAAAERDTERIYCLEQYYLELTGGDREGLEQIRKMLYADEYREGEGLAELV
ncbi:MAG: hypothetical protein M1816_002979 [Peltula sp. TS41687]|nr:MAG: hypothetical protein M1816_002979 [Peltula sp. TS41687]